MSGETERGTCWGPGCTEEITIVRCCNGNGCGCQGMPGDPPFCSQECWDAWGEEQKANRDKNLKPLEP